MATAQLSTLLRHIQQLAAGRGAPPGTDRQLLDAFAARHDESAFAALVGRHGPMVLRVCRRVLGHEQDAEDAFQATFLVLARNTASIRKHDALANWLHGVAYRTAMKAKRSAARRRNHEARLPAAAPQAACSPSWDDVQAVLDEEVQRLPARFREAFVVCVLEGKGGSEAAAELRCPEGTVKSRLNRARQLLRQRLLRRGIHLSALLAALSVAESSARAMPSVALARITVRSGLLVAAGEPAAGFIPARAAELAAGVTRAMFFTKAKVGALGLLMAGLLAATAFAWQAAAPKGQPAAPAAARPAPRKASTPGKDSVTLSGRVLGPDGKPVAGAKLFLCDEAGKSAAPQPAADGQGRFRFALASTPVPSSRFLLATADGLGVDWIGIRRDGPAQELTLHLPADVPIRGRVLDLEGRPVAGAAVRIVELSTTESGSLDEFVKRWAADKERSAVGPAFNLLGEKRLWSPKALAQLPSATTGRDGKFRLAGVGRDRGLMLGVRAPGIADHYVRVVTRPDFRALPAKRDQVALSGPEPVVTVAPSKPILGTVRDAKTKKPLAGIRVLAYTPSRPLDWWWQPIETVTDARGRYRLDGLAKSARQILAFDPGTGAPHVHRFDEITGTGGFTPITHDTELYRGVVVSGRVTDRSTGRPVRARVVYAPLLNNKHYESTPGYAQPRTNLLLWIDSREMVTGADGRYRLTALPGHGALFVQAVHGAGKFIRPSVPKADRESASYNAEAEIFLTLGAGDLFPMRYLNAYRLIRPEKGAADLTADFALDPGVRRRGRLVDPAGRPVAGAEAINLTPPNILMALPGAEFTAEALNPAEPRRVLFRHRGRKLAGTVVLRGDEREPVTVTLRPTATLTGRALRTNGEPLAGFIVEYDAWPALELPDRHKGPQGQPVLTDKEGRFRLPDLPAGVSLNLSIIVPKKRYAAIHQTKIILEPGKTRDLGDLRGEPME